MYASLRLSNYQHTSFVSSILSRSPFPAYFEENPTHHIIRGVCISGTIDLLILYHHADVFTSKRDKTPVLTKSHDDPTTSRVLARISICLALHI